jgi:hypothetical protein
VENSACFPYRRLKGVDAVHESMIDARIDSSDIADDAYLLVLLGLRQLSREAAA